MTRIAIVLGLVAVLLSSLYGLAQAQTPISQYDRTATFEIGEIIDISITDAGSQGLAFGSQLPGSLTPEAAQNVSTPAVRLTVNSSTNVTCNVVISATTFSALGASTTQPPTVLRYTAASDSSGHIGVTASEVTTHTGLIRNNTADFWHWLALPSLIEPGNYSGTVTYKAVKG